MPEKEAAIKRAIAIATEDLHACYQKWGVFASLINFSDYWARDSFWASFGMLAIGDFQQTKKTLDLFIKFQHKNGKICRKILTDFNSLKYFSKIRIKRRNLLPVYSSPIHSNFSTDDNLLFVISFCRYIEKTSDLAYAKTNMQRLLSALNFYSSNKTISNSLLVEKGLSSWMDTIFKRGQVLYTNCLWYEALKQFEELSKKISFQTEKSGNMLPKSEKVLIEIQKRFWLNNKGYFADSIFKTKIDSTFDLAGNVLALLFGIAKKEQKEKIFKKIDSNKTILHPVNDPLYPWWKINPFAGLAGIYHYHNGISWSWTESLIIAAKVKHGKIDSARKNLEQFSTVIVKTKHVYETYHLKGKPFGNFFWKSAVPFAWGSGLFLYANKQLEKSSAN